MGKICKCMQGRTNTHLVHVHTSVCMYMGTFVNQEHIYNDVVSMSLCTPGECIHWQ